MRRVWVLGGLGVGEDLVWLVGIVPGIVISSF